MTAPGSDNKNIVITATFRDQITGGFHRVKVELEGLREELRGVIKETSAHAQAAQREETAVEQTSRAINAKTKELRQLELVYGRNSQQAKAMLVEIQRMAPGFREAANQSKGLFGNLMGSGPAWQQFTRGAAATTLGVGLMTGGIVAAGVATTEFVRNSIRRFLELEQAVANIKSIAPEIDTDRLYAQLSELQTRIPATSTQLAEALYNIFGSINVSESEGLALLEKTAKGAIAARTEQLTWTQAVTGAMNAYGKTVQDVDHIQDVFFNTIKSGVVSGEQLAQLMGPLAQAGSNAGQSLETVAAALATVTRQGGNAFQTGNNLLNLLQKYPTDEFAEGLRSVGVEVKGANGELRPMLTVLEELNAVLSEMSQADQTTALQRITPDRQAQLGLSAVLKDLRGFGNEIRTNFAEAGSNVQAFNVQMETGANSIARYRGEWNQLQESFGQWLADRGPALLKWMDEYNKSAEGRGFIARTNQAGNDFFSFFGVDPDKFFDNWGGKLAEGAEESIATANKAVGEHIANLKELQAEGHATLGTVGDYYQDMSSRVDGNLSQVNAALRAAVSAHRIAVNDVGIATAEYEAAVERMRTGTVQQFDSNAAKAQEWADKVDAAATKAEEAADRVAKAWRDALVEISQAMGNLPDADVVTAPAEKARARAGIYGGGTTPPLTPPPTEFTTEQLEEYIKGLQEATRRTEQLEQAQYEAGLIDETSAMRKARLAEAERGRTEEARRQYEQFLALQGIQDQITTAEQRAAQIALQLADALEVETEALKALNRERDTEIGMLRLSQQIGEGLLRKMQRDHRDILAQMEDVMEGLRATLENTQKAGAGYLKPFQDAVTNTEIAIDNLRKRWEQATAAFDAMQREIDDARRALEARERAALRPLEAEIRGYRDALDEIADRERQALRPLDDEIYNRERGLRAMERALRDVGEAFERELLPRQKELNALNREADEMERARELRQQRISIDNLRNQLLRTAPGSFAARALRGQIGEGEQRLSISTRRDELQSEIALIEEARDTAIRAAQDRLQRERDQIDALRERREELQRGFDLERRGVEDSLRDAERRAQALRDQFEQERDILNTRQELLDAARRASEDYFKAEEARLTTLLEWNRQRLEGEQRLVDAVVATAQANVDNYAVIIRARSEAFADEEQLLSDSLADLAVYTEEREQYYERQQTAIQNNITKMQEEARIADQENRKIITGLRDREDALRRIYATEAAIAAARKAGAYPPMGPNPPGYSPAPRERTLPGGQDENRNKRAGYSTQTDDRYGFIPDNGAPGSGAGGGQYTNQQVSMPGGAGRDYGQSIGQVSVNLYGDIVTNGPLPQSTQEWIPVLESMGRASITLGMHTGGPRKSIGRTRGRGGRPV